MEGLKLHGKDTNLFIFSKKDPSGSWMERREGQELKESQTTSEPVAGTCEEHLGRWNGGGGDSSSRMQNYFEEKICRFGNELLDGAGSIKSES